MPRSQKKIRVFVGSPDDVKDERHRARAVINDLKKTGLLGNDWSLESIMWDETPYPQISWMSPQKAIEKGLGLPSECDIAVFCFWSRIGTELLEGEYSSDYRNELGFTSIPLTGTVWELCDAMFAGIHHGIPRVLAFHCKRPYPRVPRESRDEATRQTYAVEDLLHLFRDDNGRHRFSIIPYEDVNEFAGHLTTQLGPILRQVLDDEAEIEESKEISLKKEREVIIESDPQSSTIHNPLGYAISWDSLTIDQRQQTELQYGPFIDDIQEILSAPELHGIWRLAFSGPPHDLGVPSLERDIHTSRDSRNIVRLTASADYPETPPLTSSEGPDAPVLQQRINETLDHYAWNHWYRHLENSRLTHQIDEINELNDGVEQFAVEVARIKKEKPYLNLWPGASAASFHFEVGAYSVRLTASQRYPIKRPSMICEPTPPSRLWLGSGEFNWTQYDQLEEAEAPKLLCVADLVNILNRELSAGA